MQERKGRNKVVSHVDHRCFPMSWQRWESCAKVMLRAFYEDKGPLIEGAHIFWWCFLFCRHLRYWVSGVDSADVMTPPRKPWSQFLSAFVMICLQFILKDKQNPSLIHWQLQTKPVNVHTKEWLQTEQFHDNTDYIVIHLKHYMVF